MPIDNPVNRYALADYLTMQAERDATRSRIETYQGILSDPDSSLILKRYAAERLKELE